MIHVFDFLRRHAFAVSFTGAFISFLLAFSATTSVQMLRSRFSNESMQKELAAVRQERDAILRELNQALTRANSTAVKTARVQKEIDATAEGAHTQIAELLQKVQMIDVRLKDFEAMIGTDDKVKVLMATTAMAQEIAARKQFQDSVDAKLSQIANAVRSDVEPIREKLDSLQIWVIGSLLSVIVALGAVIWLLVQRAASLYSVVAAVSSEKNAT